MTIEDEFCILNKVRTEAPEYVRECQRLVANWSDPLIRMVNPLKQPKTPKGKVSISPDRDRLRLRWSALDSQGRTKRFSLAFGAPNATNRLAAQRLATQIELDIASGNFDPTLRKYKRGLDRDLLGVDVLVDQYINGKFVQTQSASIERYETLKNHLVKFLGSIAVEDIDEKKAQSFVGYLQQSCSGGTVNMYLTLLRAIWRWAIKRGLTQFDPWLELAVEVEPKQQANPFSREEIERILKGFEGNYHLDFVRFLLGVGCRIGEAIALRWDAVAEDCSEVWIGRAWDDKGRRVKSTKTNEQRSVPVPPKVQAMLQQRRQDRSSDLVFPSPKGKPIDRHNFLNRHWKPIVHRVGVEYRTPYNSRHTRWSHEISEGLDVATAARYAGNRPRTMLDRYIGSVKRPPLKDLD